LALKYKYLLAAGFIAAIIELMPGQQIAVGVRPACLYVL
jgi:hypothetical protein